MGYWTCSEDTANVVSWHCIRVWGRVKNDWKLLFSAPTGVELIIHWDGEGYRWNRFRVGDMSGVWGPIKLEVPVTHPGGDVRHLDIVSGVAKTSPRIIDWLGRFNGTWLWLMAVIYHSREIQSTVTKERRLIRQSVQEVRWSSKSPPPVDLHRTCWSPQQQIMTLYVKYHLSGNAH